MRNRQTQELDAERQTQAAREERTTQEEQKATKKQNESKKLFIPYRHIDERTLASVEDDDVQLFCSEVEIAQIYFGYAADLLGDDVAMSTHGERIFIDTTGMVYNTDPKVIGIQRFTNDIVAEIKDEYGWTWEQIGKRLAAFARMAHDTNAPLVKNTLNNRRLELYLHEILINGYTTLDGIKIAPSRMYADFIAEYQGSKGNELRAEAFRDAIPFETYFNEEALEEWYEAKESGQDMNADLPEEETEEWEPTENALTNYARPWDAKAGKYVDDVRYSTRENNDAAKSSIKQQIAANEKELNDMNVAADVQTMIPTSNNAAIVRRWALEQLKPTGYKVDRRGFGTIEFDEAHIKNSLNYLHEKGEIAAFAALPQVLKRGIIAGEHTDHKFRGFKTITFAAPVRINGVRGNMAVVVKQENRNVYKTHRILMPDGSMFEYKENTEPSTARGVAENGSYASPISSVSAQSIAQNSEDVKFSMRESVEESKNLIALHNITEEKLSKALKLGGLPMPSIAIAKTDIGHQNFGDISLVFGKETIDPQADKRNEVYSADAWTPTFPQVEYEANQAVEKRAYKKLQGLKSQIDDYFTSDLNKVLYGVDEMLNRNGGEEGFVRDALTNYGLKAAYLEDMGEHAEVVKRTEVQQREYSEKQIERYTAIAELIGLEKLRSTPVSELYAQYGEEIEEIWPGSTTMRMRFSRILQNASEYFKNQTEAPTYKTIMDSAATHKAIDERIDAAAFESWVRDLYGGIEGASGVYNGKSLYTDAGNRRSFSSTHYPVSVENIARAMYDANGGKVKNVSAVHNVKTLRAATAQTFKSIEEMHRAESRIRARTQEEADAISNALDKRLNEIVDKILRTNAYKFNSAYSNELIAMDQIAEILEEIAGKKYSATTIRNGLAKYGYMISQETAQTTKELFDEIAEMPVNIFEAKPQRAVYFDEVRFAVVPDNMNSDVRNALSEAVSDIRTYPAGDETARLELLNSEEDVKFQKRDPYNASDRELLASALESSVTNEADLQRLRLYQKRIAKLNETQQKLQETQAKIKELREGDWKTNRDEIARLKNQADIYAQQINRADGKLMQFEALAPLKELAKRQRAEYRQELRQKTRDEIREYKKEIAQKNKRIEQLENSTVTQEDVKRASFTVRDLKLRRFRCIINRVYGFLYLWVGVQRNSARRPYRANRI